MVRAVIVRRFDEFDEPLLNPLCTSAREADPGPNRRQMAGYRGGICADLTRERGQMRLFCWLPGSQPGATSGANRVKQ